MNIVLWQLTMRTKSTDLTGEPVKRKVTKSPKKYAGSSDRQRAGTVTTIQVEKETHKKLGKCGNKTETFDEIINKLVDYWNEGHEPQTHKVPLTESKKRKAPVEDEEE